MIARWTLASVVAATLMAWTAPARAEWLRAESPHFIIYGDTSESGISNYARKVERFDALLRTYYPIPIDHETPKLEIFLADGMGDMRLASPTVTASVGGWYAPNANRIYAVVNTASEMGDAVLFHEYAHHFMFQMASAAYPSWFVEGFAEYYSTADVRRDPVKIGLFSEGRMNSLTMPSNFRAPLRDVVRWRVSESGRYRGSDYYAVSWALTHYMLSDPERLRALSRTLASVAAGVEPDVALEQATGRTIEQLDGDLRRYLLRGITVLTPQIELPDAEVTVTRLNPAEARMMWLNLRLDNANRIVDEATADEEGDENGDGRADAEERAEANRLRAELLRQSLAVAGQSDDRTAVLVRAKAQRLSGEGQAALDTLAPLIGDGATDAEALRLAGRILLDGPADAEDRPAKVRQARAVLARSLDVDPLNFQTYLLLDSSRQGGAGYPTANDLSTLQVAMELAPQSFDARMRTARVLMAVGRPAEAIPVLAPVANSPHAGPSRAAGRAMLDSARQAAGLATDPAASEPVPEIDAEEPPTPVA